MKKLSLALALCGLAAAPQAFADLSGSATLLSNYVFRGMSYTQNKPALQGGVEYAHASGLYAGAYGSSVNSAALAPNASLELDAYGGYRGKVSNDLSYDVGFLRFGYPGADDLANGNKVNTLEAYGGVTWKWLNVKYSHEVSNYFGAEGAAGNTKGSHYLEGNLTFDLPQKLQLGVHGGHQFVKNGDALNLPSFSDYKVGLTKDLGGGYNVGVAYAGTNANHTIYTINGEDISKDKWILSTSKSF